jgi:hypothetical protein
MNVLTHDQIEEIGIDNFVQCVKFTVSERLEDPFIILNLNVLGVIYGVKVPKHEAGDPQNITDAWKQLISEFGVFHLLGQSKRIQHGSREETEGEAKVREEASLPS